MCTGHCDKEGYRNRHHSGGMLLGGVAVSNASTGIEETLSPMVSSGIETASWLGKDHGNNGLRDRKAMDAPVITVEQLRKDAKRRRKELDEVTTRICVGQE